MNPDLAIDIISGQNDIDSCFDDVDSAREHP
jgi:hypothetical protein